MQLDTVRPAILRREIPATTAGPLTEENRPVLLWVHSGTATVEAAQETYHLSAGEAIWIPPGVLHCTWADTGSIVLPLLPRAQEPPVGLSQVRAITVPPDWQDWMLHQYAGRSHTRPTFLSEGTLTNLLNDSSVQCAQFSSTAEALPMPQSSEARRVAQILLNHLDSPLGAGHFAQRERVSLKTLQRYFLRETGLTFSAWRTRARIVTAAGHLAKGREIGWTQRHVGYATAAGFTKAFHGLFGATPQQYAQRHAFHDARDPKAVDELLEQSAPIIIDTAEVPPVIPARQIWERINSCHVLLWICRGETVMHIGSRRCILQQGQAIWVPAGVTHSVEFAEGSILLPLGNRYGRSSIGVNELSIYSFPPEAETLLLHTSVTEYTLFHPENATSTLTDELFRTQFITDRKPNSTTGLTGAVGVVAQSLWKDPADARSLAQWAAHLRTSPQQLGQEFLSQTGDSFPRWRAQLRMNIARQLLIMGDRSGEIAKRLGYASPSAFTKAFTAAHGLSPRGYQHRETGRGEQAPNSTDDLPPEGPGTDSE